MTQPMATVVADGAGYEWRLDASDSSVVALCLLLLPDELDDDAFADYTGLSKVAAHPLRELFSKEAGPVAKLAPEQEHAVRMHLRLLPEMTSASSFEDFVGVPKTVAIQLERRLDLLGFEAARAAARQRRSEEVERRLRAALEAATDLRTYEVMTLVRASAVARCHAIEFGDVLGDVTEQAVGTALLQLVATRPTDRPGYSSLVPWLVDTAAGGSIDLGFVVAEHTAAQGSQAGRDLLVALTARTSRPGLRRAIEARLLTLDG